MNVKKNELKKVWYLEMLRKDQFLSKKLHRDAVVIKQERPKPKLNRFFYTEVGKLWKWTDRLDWSIAEWNKWVERNELKTWILHFKAAPAGYFELNIQNDDVEIAYFGLLPKFIGKGLGGGFLSYAVEKAWEFKKKRIWVHTCNYDHPNALKNYKARGFEIYKETPS